MSGLVTNVHKLLIFQQDLSGTRLKVRIQENHQFSFAGFHVKIAEFQNERPLASNGNPCFFYLVLDYITRRALILDTCFKKIQVAAKLSVTLYNIIPNIQEIPSNVM